MRIQRNQIVTNFTIDYNDDENNNDKQKIISSNEITL